MKIGIVGYQGSGKSTLFHWLTSQEPDPSRAHLGQSAMAVVPDGRVDSLAEVYHPKKITLAALELVDTPGLSREHEGNAQRLSLIREAGCLVVVVAAYDGTDPVKDLASFDEDLLLADLEIVTGRVERLRESVKRPRPTQEQEKEELEALEPLLDVLNSGKPLFETELTDQQLRATSSFRLLTEKPRLVVINMADDAENAEQLVERFTEREEGPGAKVVALPVGLQLELAQMDEADRTELTAEMGLEVIDSGGLVREILDVSAQMLFFTAGEKEVRTWLIHQGATALEAADGIHSDMARGFIRAETMDCADLVRLGSEREIKAAGLVRQEPKDYVLQDGDILNIKFNV